MALLQVHKALNDLHDGNHDPEVLTELCTATDLALRVTKVTALSLGHVMSTLVVQECHHWLYLVDMREANNFWFLNASLSQAPSLNAPLSSATRWITLQLNKSCPGVQLLPPPPGSKSSLIQASNAVEPVAGQPQGNPEMDGTALLEMVNAQLPPPEEGRVENLLFLFSLPHGQWYPKT